MPGAMLGAYAGRNATGQCTYGRTYGRTNADPHSPAADTSPYVTRTRTYGIFPNSTQNQEAQP